MVIGQCCHYPPYEDGSDEDAVDGDDGSVYSLGQVWAGFPSLQYTEFQKIHGRISWPKGCMPTNYSITPQPKTHFDRLPPEVLQYILKLSHTPGFKGSRCRFGQCPLKDFHKAWPGSYYAWLTAPLVNSELSMHTERNYRYELTRWLDSALSRPQLRFWIRDLELWDGVRRPDVELVSCDDLHFGEYESLEEEAKYLRRAATRILGDVDVDQLQQLFPRSGEVFEPQTRIRLLLYLLPNIELLSIWSRRETYEVAGWLDFHTVLQQYRDTLAAAEGDLETEFNIDILNRRLAIEEYLFSTATMGHDAAHITPFMTNLKYAKFICPTHSPSYYSSFPGAYLLQAFFLPRISSIYGLGIGAPVADIERPEWGKRAAGSTHKHDLGCWAIINPYCLAPLFGTSPVTTLMFSKSILSFTLGSFLRLPKSLTVFSYKRFVDDYQKLAYLHLGDLAWGLDPHKDTLEVLEVTSGNFSRDVWRASHRDHDISMPAVAAGFSSDRISTLRNFRRLREVKLDYWMLAGKYHVDSDVGLTSLPESLETLSIEFNTTYNCPARGPCQTKIRHVQELLQKKNELFPKLKKVELIFTSEQQDTLIEQHLWDTFQPMALAAGLESFRVKFVS